MPVPVAFHFFGIEGIYYILAVKSIVREGAMAEPVIIYGKSS